MICNNLSDCNGILHFNGQNTLSLAQQYGTPLYLMDSYRIRSNCRAYRTAMQEHFGAEAMPL